MKRSVLTTLLFSVLATIAVMLQVSRHGEDGLRSLDAGLVVSPVAAVRRPTVASDGGRADRFAAPAAHRDGSRHDRDAADAGRVPRSLRGTEVDGALAVDDAGRFVPTVDARRFFDYFLAATGEVPPAELRARIVAAIQARLAAEPAAAATVLLDRYLEYRERTRALAAELGDSDLDIRLERLQRLRADVLGPTFADALFDDEDAVHAVEAERQRIARDESRSADDRARAMLDLEARLPAPEREARAEALAPVRLGREESRMRAEGASLAEIRALRESYFGVDAAARLEQLDRKRDEWQRRLTAYRAARAAIDSDASLSPDERSARTTRLVDESFTPTERLRVDALDQIARGGGDDRLR